MKTRLREPSGRGGEFTQPSLHLLAEYCTLLARRPFTSDYGDSVRPKWGDGLDFYNDEVKTQSGEGDVDLARPGCSLSPPRFPVVTNEPGTVSRVSEFLPMHCPH